MSNAVVCYSLIVVDNVICVLDREAADKVVKGEGKFEELMVCSQEIAASTTQLVVASKVGQTVVWYELYL